VKLCKPKHAHGRNLQKLGKIGEELEIGYSASRGLGIELMLHRYWFGFWRNYVRSSIWFRFRIHGRNYVRFRTRLWLWIWFGFRLTAWDGRRWRSTPSGEVHHEYHRLSDAKSEAADSSSTSTK
jgi:hypothetical protein